ncbi:MAG TPA: hypothetical protein VFS43_41530 [Polyangiaceae bacterium]|nr:hypothetical protein [Polyangiaceae bacterium]
MSLSDATAGSPPPAPARAARPRRTPRRAPAPRAPRQGAALAVLASLLASGPLGAAEPDVKRACADAFTQAQRLRRSAKLIDARREAKACASEACPNVAQRECERLVGELERAIPSVLVRVRDAANRETLGAKVTLDGKPFTPPPAGLAAELDPGPHVFEIAYQGKPPQRQEIVLYEGEKSRPVSFSFAEPTAPAPAASSAAPAAAPPPRPPAEGKRGVPTISYVLGGVGLVGVAGFAALGLSARGELDDLKKSCGPSCPSDDVDPVRRRALFADLSLGVGLLSLGAATYFFLSARRPPPPSAAALDAFALPGGGALTLRQSF